jgi:hypothetical protein
MSIYVALLIKGDHVRGYRFTWTILYIFRN